MASNWFIGVPVDTEHWFAPLVATAPSSLQVFHPDDVHLTVAFLGECGEEAAMAAWRLAEEIPAPAFEVTLARLAGLGPPDKPSAISAELNIGRDNVSAWLGAYRDALCDAARASREVRAPRPHITVGRPPRDCSSEVLAALLAWAHAVPPIGAALRLDRLALYTWSHDRRARQFQTVYVRG